MKNDINEKNVNFALKEFYDTATNNIQTSALVNRALADKISTETINQKVNNQLNSIYFSMNKINPKFNENSKNYGIVKQDILDVLTDYEGALTEFSDYYDLKLEKLILKKVELESNLVGKVFREEKLKENEKPKVRLKSKDYLKMSFSEKAKDIALKVSMKKENNSFNCEENVDKPKESNLEKNKKLNKRSLKIKRNNSGTNQKEIAGIEKEIRMISKEISETNEKKRLELEKAMETRDKWISVTLKKPSVWSRTKSFFSNRFNTAKVVSKTVITPLRLRVKEFRNNELEGLKE